MQGREARKGRLLTSFKEKDKQCSAFLLQSPGPKCKLQSAVFGEAAATLLGLPSLVCMDPLGERVGGSREDRFGKRVILENLTGATGQPDIMLWSKKWPLSVPKQGFPSSVSHTV